MKYCSKCKATLPLDEFYNNRTSADGKQIWCKPCWKPLIKRNYLANKQRINRRVATTMRRNLLAKGGRIDEPEACEACGVPPTHDRNAKGCKRPQGLSYDHDHKPGKFRGWLCTRCNTALGLMDDDPVMLRMLADYVRTPPFVWEEVS